MTDSDLQAIRARNATRRTLKAACPPIARRPGRRYDLDMAGTGHPLYTSNIGPNDATAWILTAREDDVEEDVDRLIAEVERLRTDVGRFNEIVDSKENPHD